MKDFYKHSPRSLRVLVPITALMLLALIYVESGRRVVPSPWYDEMLRASNLSARTAHHLKQVRLERGAFVDTVNDPAQTALIGQEYSQITTDRGSLDAKLSSTDPNFAAVVVDMLRQVDVQRGDCVAVAMTGSFPALNLSTLAAIETLALRPVVISSVGASNYGATDPYFTWLDMERSAVDQGLLTTSSSAASLGGGDDSGRGLSPLGRDLLRDAIERNSVPLLANGSLEANIERRLELYRQACQPHSIAAFINVGGGIASLGHSLNSGLIPNGASTQLPRRNYPARGVLLKLAEDDVPIIQLLNINQLRQRYGLAPGWQETPLPGEGAVFGQERYSMVRTATVTLLLLGTLLALFLYDRHVHRLGQTGQAPTPDPKASNPLPPALTAAGCAAILLVGLAAPVRAQVTVPIFVSGQDRAYEALSSSTPSVVTVRGPGDLRLVTRARFAPDAPDQLRYALKLRIDGGDEQTILFENVERSRTALFRDSNLGVPGRLTDHRIKLRRGYHNIEILAGAEAPPIFFRHLFEPKRERRRSWVAVTPLDKLPASDAGSAKAESARRLGTQRVDIVVREAVVPYYRNAPNEAFHVEVIGPTELRIFTRLENTPEMRGRIHYRLQIRRDGEVVNTFQLSSRRSYIATYLEVDHLVPGRAAEVVIPIPDGRHHMEVLPLDPDKSTLLARFMLPREDLSLTAE